MSFFLFCNSDTMIQRCIAGNLNYFDPGKLALFSAQNGKSDELMSSGLHDGDVLAGDSNGLKKIFSVSDDETFIYVTNKCNSNCIMCPSSQWERRNGSHMSVDEIIESIRYYPDSINYVTITGGEPLLLKEDLFRILDFLKNKKPQAGYLLLTNGRGFAINKYAQLLRNSAPKNTLVGVPLHSADAQKHDYISGCHGEIKKARIKAGYGVRYTVPQLIRCDRTSPVTIRFRVSSVFHNASIVVLSDGKEIQRKRKRIMAPGEMESLKLDGISLSSELEIRIEVEQ